MKKAKFMTKIVSFLLAVAMMLTSLPMTAMANPDTSDETVTVSVSYDGKYLKNSSGEYLAQVPVSLSELGKIKLTEYGLDSFIYDGNQDGSEDITVLHLFIYTHTKLYGGDWSAVSVSGAPGSLYFAGGLCGFTENMTYYANGQYPIDQELSEAWGYSTGATADKIVLSDGDFIDLAGYADYSFWMDSEAGFHYFKDAAGNITYNYQAEEGTAFSVALGRAVQDWSTGNLVQTLVPVESATVYYSQTLYDAQAASAVTQADGSAALNLGTAGTWYVWADGREGSMGSVVSAPAYAKVTVVSQNAAPTLAENYQTGSAVADVTAGDTYTLDLSKVFTDTDGDSLTYTVAVGTDEAIPADAQYSYAVPASGQHTLVFKANDGKADSVPFTVTINASKKQAKLESLIIHSSTSPSDTNVYLKNSGDSYTSTDLIFDGDTLSYKLDSVLTDSTTQLRFRAKVNGNGEKVTLYYDGGEKDITWTSGSSKWANFLKGGNNKFTMVVSPADEDTESVTYSFEIAVTPTLSALDVAGEEAVYWDSAFKAATKEYTLTLAESVKTLTLAATPKYDSYAVTYNGKDSAVVDISNTDKIAVEVSKDGISNTYTLNLNKTKEAALEVETTPEDAVVAVYDHNGTSVKAGEDGRFTGMFGAYEYTYTVAKNGYVTKSGTVPADGGKISVSLEKVAGEQPKEVSAYWPNFRGDESNMAITDARTPQSEDVDSIAVKWVKKLGSGWSAAPSVQIIVDNALVVMSGTGIYKLDLQTGEILAQGTMVAAPNFGYTPPTYAAGMIFCPLSNGTIQAFHAETLESLWVYKDALKGQSLSPITYSDGYIYTGFWNGENKNANFVCIGVTDENVEKTDEEKAATWKHTQMGGFYWAGSAVIGDTVVVGTDDGTSGTEGNSYLYAFNKYTGKVISRLELTGAGDQRSSIAYDEESGRIFFTTKGGYLYRADVDEKTGEITNLKGVDNQAQTTSTPVIYKGRVYYATGSGISSTGSSGNVVVADAETLEMLFAVGLKGYPQCSLLLSTAYEKQTGCIYLYSTYNNMPGGISVLKVKTDCKTAEDAQLTELYDAAGFEQYCITSIICGEDGTLYYKNDSTNIFAIGVPSVVNVEKLIQEIGTVSLDSEGAISAARASYNALSAKDQKQVSNYEILTKAEAVYQEFVKADVVDQKIAAIGKVSLLSKVTIESVREAYDALSETEKEKVTQYKVLTDAEAAYEKLVDEAVSEVEKLIERIGNVSVYSEDEIEEARAAYAKLPAELKPLVDNLNVLENAEEELEDVKVEHVQKLIDSIGTVTLDSKTAINRARAAYEKLSSANKKRVDNREVLVAAEAAYTKLAKGSKTTNTKKEDTGLSAFAEDVKEMLESLTEGSVAEDILEAVLSYEELTGEEKAALDKANLVESLRLQLAELMQTDSKTGIGVSGCDWNVQLVVEEVLKVEKIQKLQEDLGENRMLGLWNVYLKDVLTGKTYEAEEEVLVKIPLEELGDYTAYDGLTVVHYTEDGKVEYLNCTVVGDCIVFNTAEFSHYAVVGYEGMSPAENAMSTQAEQADLSWLPWTIAGVAGVILLGALVLLTTKNKAKNKTQK